MFQNQWTVLVLSAALLAACDETKPEPPGSRQATPAAGAATDSAAATTAVATATATAAATPSLAPTASPSTTSAVASASATATVTPSVTPTATSAATATTPTAAPGELKTVPEIRIHDPEGVEFVRQRTWRLQEPDWTKLENMEHATNAPVTDIVVMHSAVLTTADDELKVLQSIMAAHMSGRGWADISAHYLVGPSGKVYQGRNIRYRADGSAGAGMGRFQDLWSKCVIMLLGDFNNPAQVFTPEAQSALSTLIEDRKEKFGRMYRDALEAREAETKVLLGPNGNQGPYGLDVIRVRKHPSLPAAIQSFLDAGGNTNTAGDGGTKP